MKHLHPFITVGGAWNRRESHRNIYQCFFLFHAITFSAVALCNILAIVSNKIRIAPSLQRESRYVAVFNVSPNRNEGENIEFCHYSDFN